MDACHPPGAWLLGDGADALVYVDDASDSVIKRHHFASTFFRELTALRKVTAIEVVRLLSFCTEEQTLRLERFDCDLFHYLSEEYPLLNPYQGAYFQLQACRSLMKALATCHELGVQHNDVKIENVLVTKHPLRIVLADFGRASFQGISDEVMRGTRTYMAPEVFEGRATPKSDCWSAGVVCFTCFERQMPFDEDDDNGPLSYGKLHKSQRWPQWASWLVDGLLRVEEGLRLSSLEALQLMENVHDPFEVIQPAPIPA